MRYELMVAVRFLRQSAGQSLLVFGGAAVGVGVIIFLTALLGGLQASLIQKSLGSQAHIVVKPQELLTRRVYQEAAHEVVAAIVEHEGAGALGEHGVLVAGHGILLVGDRTGARETGRA